MTERSAGPLRALELDRGSFMAKNRLQQLHDVGQSIWLDSIDYDDQITEAEDQGLTSWQLFELLETTDVRDACDRFAGVYSSTRGADGFVSIEISPGVSHDADAAVEEARRLWKTVDRPNVMVKVPGSIEGAIAVRRLIAEGVNVNITLLFALQA